MTPAASKKTGKSKRTSSHNSRARRRTGKKKPGVPATFKRLGKMCVTSSLVGMEVGGLLLTMSVCILLLLGYSAHVFSGTDLWYSIIPFLLSVCVACFGVSFSLIIWLRFRQSLSAHSPVFAPMVVMVLIIGAGLLASNERFHVAFTSLRLMVGGKAEVNRNILSHQVYAAYRREKGAELRKLVKRAEPYAGDIIAAADTFSLESDLLFGLAAAESSFYPRKSKDGGEGLFQITSVPKGVKKTVARLLPGVPQIPSNRKYNTFIAAATLRTYLDQMNGDPLLGVLAYNIGPANGGLQFIMEHYRAYTFSSIQPYLKSNPRRYPIRVLSFALAFRIWHQHGELLTYEKKGNAVRIQRIAIPGLDAR